MQPFQLPGRQAGMSNGADTHVTAGTIGSIPRNPEPSKNGLWESLYEECGERVFRMLHRMMGDAALAEDLTQECFVRVHQRARQYTGRGEREAWVFRIARNLARDELRRTRRHGFLLGRAPMARHQPAGAHELRLTLRRLLEELPSRQREVLLLHDVDGYTHSEIGEMLGITAGTSKSNLSRARAKLRPHLEDE